MNYKKGFTLIELLAVIVILAIISLIATPIILGIIEDARKGAFEESARNTVNAAENYYATSNLKNVDSEGICYVFNYSNDVEEKTLIEDGTYQIPTSELDLSGKKVTNGNITTCGTYSEAKISDGKYTYILKITGEELLLNGGIDDIAPTVSVTVSEFNVSIELSDNTQVLAYAINMTNQTPEEWTNLENNLTEYTASYTAESPGVYYVFVKDTTGNISSTSFSINLPDIEWATVVAQAHENNNYSTSATYAVPEGYNKLIVNELSAGTYCSGNTTGIIYGITSTGSQVVIYSKTFAAPGNGTITHNPGEFDISGYSSIKFYVSGTSGYYWGGTQFKGITIKQIN